MQLSLAAPPMQDRKDSNSVINEALSAMGFSMPPVDHPMATMWRSVLQGRDVAAMASPTSHVAASLPPVLASLACNPISRCLVLAPAEAVARLEEELAFRGRAVAIDVVGPQLAKERWPMTTQCLVGNPDALLQHLNGKDLPSALGNHLILVLLWADELVQVEEAALREFLMSIPQPKHTLMTLTSWTQSVAQLSSQILIQPIFAQLVTPDATSCEPAVEKVTIKKKTDKQTYVILRAGKQVAQCAFRAFASPEHAFRAASALCEMAAIGASKEEIAARKKAFQSGERKIPNIEDLPAMVDNIDDCQACPGTLPIEQALNSVSAIRDTISSAPSEDAQMLAKYIANIVCRSSNAQFRESVLELLPPVRKRKASSQSQETQTSQDTPEEASQHSAIQEGIASLLASTAKFASLKSTQEAIRKSGGAQEQGGEWLSEDDVAESD